jgi:hypothetical protein
VSDIKELILADAKIRKERYSDRMTVTEPELDDLPSGLKHYSVEIYGLHSYLPINYLTVENDETDFYTSLRKGDFTGLLKRLSSIETDRFSALDIAILFLLLEHPSRDRRIIEKIEDIALPEAMKESDRQDIAHAITPPTKTNVDGGLECSFVCLNVRTSGIERYIVRISADYTLSGESGELLHFGHIAD